MVLTGPNSILLADICRIPGESLAVGDGNQHETDMIVGLKDLLCKVWGYGLGHKKEHMQGNFRAWKTNFIL